MFAVYDALMLTDSSTGEIKPQLAESLTSSDRIVWTLKIKPNVKFSDGTAYDANAVKFNWDRHADPANNSTAINLMKTMKSIEVVDAQTLRITLAGENGQFPRAVAANLSWIGSPTAIQAKGKDFGNSPVGAGPFTLKEWTRDSRMVLSRNPTYWNAPLPYVDELIIRIVPDAQQRMNSVNNNEGDMALISELAIQKAAKDAGLQLHAIPGIGASGLVLNMTREPFNDVRVRKAIQLSVDRTQLNQVVTDGVGEVVTSWFPTDSAFYDASAAFPKMDLVEAQKLIDAYVAEKGKNVSFTVETSDAGVNPRLNDFLVATFKKLTKVEVKSLIVPQNQSTTDLRNRNYDMVSYAFLGVDPEPQFYETWHSKGTRNFIGFADADVDAALLRARNSTDTAARKADYVSVQKKLIDTGSPMLVTQRSQSSMVAKKDRVQGVKFFEDGGLRFDLVWIKK
jgi:peptide/nickel transport system substrate-binding protein